MSKKVEQSEYRTKLFFNVEDYRREIFNNHSKNEQEEINRQIVKMFTKGIRNT